jgi:group I intron endonuclease
MGYIYLITCLVTKRQYIGQTTNTVEDRWDEHRAKARQVIYHKDEDDERLREQGILHSYLYNAMAHYGIQNFTIETLEESPDEDLNYNEKFWISELNTLSPNGYNLMSGGGSGGKHSDVTRELISKTKCKNVDENRNAKLRGLPPYVSYRNNPAKGGEMIRVNNHPLCKGKNFLVKEYDNCFEKTRAAVIVFMFELEVSGEKYSRPKIGADEFADMPGLCKTPKGYRVNKVHKGKNYDKRFQRKDKTDEENKQAAIAYYNDLIKKLI